MTRRLKDSLVAQQNTTTDLTREIRTLTARLLWFTIALGVIGIVQLAVMILQIVRK